jgi:hypothetical protein
MMSIWGWLCDTLDEATRPKAGHHARGARRRRRSAMPAPFVTGKRSGTIKVPWGGFPRRK